MTYLKILHDNEPTALVRFGKRNPAEPMIMQKATPRNPRWIKDVAFVAKYVYQMDDPEDEITSAPSGFSVEITESEADLIKAEWN